MIWILHFTIINILLVTSYIIKKKNFFVVSTFIYSLFTFGQRWMTGEDFPGYLLYYLIDFQGTEIGYYIVQSFFSNLDLYFGNLIFLVYGITLYNNYRLIRKLNKSNLLIYLYMFVELYFLQMSQIRQFLAISFFIHSYYYVFYKNYFKSLLFLILATSFHISSLLVAPFLLIRKKLDITHVFFISLIFLILPLIDIKIIFEPVLKIVYGNYLDSAYNVNLSQLHIIRYYVIVFLYICFIYKLKGPINNKIEQLIIYGSLLHLLFYGLSFHYAPMMRISYYFKIFELIFFIHFIYRLNNISPNLLKIILIVIFISLYIGIVISDPYNIGRYEFRFLQLFENRSVGELFNEIDMFYLE